MKRVIALLLMTTCLSIILAACGDLGTDGQQPDALTAAPCVTATPVPGNGTSTGKAIATPAGRTAPFSGSEGNQPTTSPSELATREAQLEQQNRPVQVPTEGQAGSTSLPVCPTPTPAR